MSGWPTCRHAAATPGGPICKCWVEDCGHCLLVMKRCSRPQVYHGKYRKRGEGREKDTNYWHLLTSALRQFSPTACLNCRESSWILMVFSTRAVGACRRSRRFWPFGEFTACSRGGVASPFRSLQPYSALDLLDSSWFTGSQEAIRDHQKPANASYGHRLPYLVGFWSSEHATFSSSHASDWRRYTTFIHFSLTNHCHLVVKLLPTVAQDGIQVHGGPRQKSRKASDIPCTAVYDWWKDI